VAGDAPAASAALVAATPAAAAAPAPAAAPAGPAVDYTKILPKDLIDKTPKGKLVNPYKDSQEDIVADGSKIFQGYACSGCHGGGAGGGMCPPLTNDVWVYGGDDDTLFRLVTLGSIDLQASGGYTRIGREAVVGPMPPFGAIIKSADDLWRILAFVRSKYGGDPAYKFGAPPEESTP
jgi:mono/diheme cytochrome c family protein